MGKQGKDNLDNLQKETEEMSVPKELSDGELFDKDEADSDTAEDVANKEPEPQEQEIKESTDVSSSSNTEISQTPEFIKNELLEAAAEMDEMENMNASENSEKETESEDDFSYLFTDEMPVDEQTPYISPEISKQEITNVESPESEMPVDEQEEYPEPEPEHQQSEETAEETTDEAELVSPDQETEKQEDIKTVSETATESESQEEEIAITENEKEEITEEQESPDENLTDEFQAIISASVSEEDNDTGYYMFGSKKDDFAVDDDAEERIKIEQEAAASQSSIPSSSRLAHPPMDIVFTDDRPLVGEKTFFTYGFGDGEAMFFNKDGLGTIEFNNPGKDGIEAWKLILSETKIIPLFDMAGMTMELPKNDTIRGTLVGKNGETISIFNAEKFIIPVEPEASIAEANPNAVITGDFKVSDLEVWNLVLTDTRILPFTNIEKTQEIELPKGACMNGSLIGPENHVLNFFGVEKVIVNQPEEKEEDLSLDKTIPKFENMFEGIIANNSNKPVFVFSEAMGSKAFEGSEDKSIVEVVTGPDGAYGWNIVFANGVRMGMHDLLKYQSKYGSMPDSSGKLSRGRSSLKFTGVTRIYTYTKPTYSGYLYGIPTV